MVDGRQMMCRKEGSRVRIYRPKTGANASSYKVRRSLIITKCMSLIDVRMSLDVGNHDTLRVTVVRLQCTLKEK
jgi:hypothetical protein